MTLQCEPLYRELLLISEVPGCPPGDSVGAQCTSSKSKAIGIILQLCYQIVKMRPIKSQNVEYINSHTVGKSLGGHWNVYDSKKWSSNCDRAFLAIDKYVEGKMATKM